MGEFSNKILVQSAKDYLQLTNQIKSSGYSPYLFALKEKAKKSVQNQINLYEASVNQKELKIK